MKFLESVLLYCHLCTQLEKAAVLGSCWLSAGARAVGVGWDFQISEVVRLTSVWAAVAVWHSEAPLLAPVSPALPDPWHSCERGRDRSWPDFARWFSPRRACINNRQCSGRINWKFGVRSCEGCDGNGFSRWTVMWNCCAIISNSTSCVSEALTNHMQVTATVGSLPGHI